MVFSYILSKKMFLFSGSQCKDLAENVARKANLELGRIKLKAFPDNEIYIRILENVKDKDCLVMPSTTSNDALMELLFILDALSNLEASKIHLIIPYFTGFLQLRLLFLLGVLSPLSS